MEISEDIIVRFLIIRMSSIGDIVLTTPLVRCLKQQVPGAEVHYLVKKAFFPVVQANPYIDKIHIFEGDLKQSLKELREERIDYLVDLHRNFRSAYLKSGLRVMHFSFRKLNLKKWLLVRLGIDRMPSQHIVDRYLETLHLFDVTNDGKGLDYFIPKTEELSMADIPLPFRKGYVLFVIGANHATKRPENSQIIRIIEKMNLPVILAGGPAEKTDAEEILAALSPEKVWNSCGQFGINGSASLVRQASLVISPDTGLMHIAAAFGKKILSLWGNTVPRFGMSPYLPHPDSRMFEVEGLRCRPCSKIGYPRCPKKHFHCMRWQDEEKIAETARILFAGKEASPYTNTEELK